MKGQIRMFETVAVLVVFFFLIGISLSFYFVFQKAGTEKEIQKEFQRQAVETVQRISTFPELDCAQIGIQTENCFDALKINAFSELMEEQGEQARTYYYPMFGFSNITVHYVYPEEEPRTIYVNKPEEKGYDLTQVPILVYHPVEKNYAFAILEVRTYE